jgi:hypothetical protein
MNTLWQVIQLVGLAVTIVVLLYERREARRLREQNAEMQQLVADAAAQATLDSEHAVELLNTLQQMRAENAALKGRQ